jgi:hypothetical protein
VSNRRDGQPLQALAQFDARDDVAFEDGVDGGHAFDE